MEKLKEEWLTKLNSEKVELEHRVRKGEEKGDERGGGGGDVNGMD